MLPIMPTTPEAARARWARLSKAERRRKMEPALKAALESIEARKLAKAIDRINASGGMTKAIARVKAAGYQLEAAS